MFALEQEKLDELINRITVRITQQVAKIDLCACECGPEPGGDLCTIYTTISGAYLTKLSLCAERSFLRRMTENMMEEPLSDPEDLEEYAKEFFNVLCGHIVGEIHRLTKAGASFHPPCFVYGDGTAEPGGHEAEALICFTSDRREQVVVLHDELTAK